jgi:ribose 5-phosphate isomerase B
MDLDALQKALREARRRPARAGHGRVEPASAPQRRIALGADHGGFVLKQQIKAYLQELACEVVDVGVHDTQPSDYPDLAVAVARQVASGECALGIVIDAAGLGSCMAANKVRGVRAATCHDETTARNSREHNDANVLVLGSRIVSPGHARRIVRVWLDTAHAGGRHAARVAKINALDGGR